MQALVGMSDGIPMFRGKTSRMVVPIALRNANLPESLGIKFRHIHLAALYPGEYWEISDGNWKRTARKPKTIVPLIYVLADDLLHWQDGDYVEDTSLDEGHQDRQFLLRTCLLYWSGDYPGLAEVSGFIHGTATHGMCHWCELIGTHNMETGSRNFAGFCRWMEQGDPRRRGNTESRPRPREHMRACAQAEQNEEWTGQVQDTPVKFTGVRIWCPLVNIP